MNRQTLSELTVRAVLLGGVITLLFTAANVYLGLKIGLTFATSIPAAVISMAVLRLFRHSSILENNIVQTVASAAGTLAAIIFVLPGLVMIGWWQGFPYWTTMGLTALGGILGVMFSVPLRRSLVVDTDLPYPEGVAAAEVLLVGEQARDGNVESRWGLAIVSLNSVVSALFFALSQTGLVANEMDVFFRVGSGSTGVMAALSMAEIGAGHLVGISVGIAMLVGIILGWWILLPILTAHSGMAGSAATVANAVFHSDIRFFGAGVIGIAALWTFARILGPIVGGLRSALNARGTHSGQVAPVLSERDLPIRIVGAICLGALALMGVLLWQFIAGGPLAPYAVALVGSTVLYVFLAGVIIASICGYMAGLIGASNSPLSGVGILAVIAAALLVSLLTGRGVSGVGTTARIAYALFATALVFGVATISNDNLQDLKTGQLVGATPWRQQIALVYGVIFGALVIPPVLRLLDSSYGFAGAPGAGPHALPAPQAALISALAQGMLGGHLNLRMIGLGAMAGAVLIAVDVALGRTGRMRLPTLAIGLGVYLPMGSSLAVVIGAITGYFYDRWARRARRPDFAKRMGVLMATGMIVGESLFGVVYAGIVVFSGSSAPFALVGDGFAMPAMLIGVGLFASLIAALYWRARRAPSMS